MPLWLPALLLAQLGRLAPGQGELGSASRGVLDSFPSVLVVVADDVNWDDLESVALPNLAALAARGVAFRSHYAFPLCSPTRYALLFGRYPRRDGIGRLVGLQPPSPTSPAPPLELVSLAEVCRALPGGAARSALIGKWHLGTNLDYDGDPAPDFGPYDTGALTPQMQGFAHFLAGTMLNLPQGLTGGDYFRWRRVDDGIYSVSREYAPRAQLDAFLAFWAGPGRRLAVLAPNLPHAPLHDPPPDFLPPGAGAQPSSTSRQRFERMLQAFDQLLGRALAVVDLERTYVFVLADNGTQPGLSLTPCPPGEAANPNSEGCTKGTVMQGGIRVPLFVAGPGIPAGASTDAVVSTADILATIAELLAVAAPGEDSISFAPLLRAPGDPRARARRIAFSEIFGTFTDAMGQPYARADQAAIGERYKLIVSGGQERLFDLALDPHEFAPLDLGAPELASELARLRAVIADPLERARQGG